MKMAFQHMSLDVVFEEVCIEKREGPRTEFWDISTFQTQEQWATFARVWYLLDGKMQPPGKLAAMASVKLQGLHKPIYHQLSDCGDHVVIMNTRHIAFSGNKWEQKVYSSHTGYPGGFKQVTAAQLHQKDPVAIVKLAIYGMLPKNLHRRTLMQRLHLFPDEDIPEDIRKNLVEELPQPRKVPRRLDEYTQEEIEAFPRVWSPPEDYRL
uniref:Large ribosomal subunit protein uL13m n=1 Tax=Callorhinus ursinus TaxID=34884 RepID=A0A3Q7NZD4_CALUR|nr:39S ribosomal protein L13, mitochondrial isoform X1 [Callorhinus ursinus]